MGRSVVYGAVVSTARTSHEPHRRRAAIHCTTSRRTSTTWKPSAPTAVRCRLTRPDAYGWTVPEHGPAVTVRYKVFGDFVDGTYLAIDPTHAHLNMPASVMWARGLDDRPLRLAFVAAGRRSLGGRHPALSDRSPAGVHRTESAVPDGQPGRVRAGVDASVLRRRPRRSVSPRITPARRRSWTASSTTSAEIVAAEHDIFGEFPTYEPGAYTFIADYLPYASGDGMEHRNSTVMTSASAIRTERGGAARHGCPRVLPQLERRAHPPALARAVRFRARQHVRRAVAGRRIHAVLRPALDEPRRCRRPSRDRSTTSNDLITSALLSPGRSVRSARR